MNYVVTYRDASGTLRTKDVEAASRADCFRQLKERGVTPQKVTEGRSSTYGKPASSFSVPRLLTFASLVLALGLGGWLAFRPSGQLPQQTQPPAMKKAAGESPVRALARAPRPPKETAAPAPPQKAPLTGEARRARLDAIRNGPARGPKVDMDTYVSKDPDFAQRWERFKAEQAKLPFKYMSENIISRIIATKPGETILPMAIHPRFEQDFLKSLDEKIVYKDDDDEETKELKRTMVEVKKQLKAAMDRGESIRDILTEEQNHLAKIATMRDNLYRELKAIEKSAASVQEIDDYVKAANVMLDEYGAKHIKLGFSKARYQLKKEGKLK